MSCVAGCDGLSAGIAKVSMSTKVLCGFKLTQSTSGKCSILSPDFGQLGIDQVRVPMAWNSEVFERKNIVIA